ncbi:tektin bundle-interacting protein 1 [Theristicus caerulescens]
MLWGPRQAPLLKQAMRWKTTPMGWDAVGQSWATGPSAREEAAVEEPWCTLTCTIARCRWQWAHAARGSAIPCPPVRSWAGGGTVQGHLRAVACWDPIVPAEYPGPRTRWGPFLWQERPVLGKEYVVTRSQSSRAPGCSSGYVPVLSCRPAVAAGDISTWSLLHHQPSTHQ